MALNTTTDIVDLAQYQMLEGHLMNILERNTQLAETADASDRPLTSDNIASINDTISLIQLNLQSILSNAAVIDTVAPTVSAYFPADGATDVPITSNLVITFNKPVQKGTGNILIRENGVTIQTIDVTSGSVTINSNIVTINPANMSVGVTVSVQIPVGAIVDLSNNNYAGILNDTTWNFSTPVA